MTRIHLTIELQVTAPAGDAVEIARSIVIRQGFLVVDARVADNGTGTPARHPAQCALFNPEETPC